MEGMQFFEFSSRMNRNQIFVYEFDKDANCIFYFEDGSRAVLSPSELMQASRKIQQICDILGDEEYRNPT